MSTQRIKLWDLPTRLFHWLLVLSIVAAIVTGKVGGNAIVWHGRIGLFIVGLLVFRLTWGLIGSTYARFANFIPSPASVIAYLRGEWRGLGHNPLGALSVFGLLTLTAVQVGTGLFADDDIAFRGPLAVLVDKDFSDTLTRLHRLAVNALIALIVFHLLAILFYAHVKKHNLLRPMINGWTDAPADEAARPATGGGPLAFIVALLVAIAATAAAAGAWLPPPPAPPAAQQAPAW